MSLQGLSEKNTKRWAEKLGLPIERMVSNGGYWFGFRTTEDKHGFVNKISGKVEWTTDPNPHWSSCPTRNT